MAKARPRRTGPPKPTDGPRASREPATHSPEKTRRLLLAHEGEVARSNLHAHDESVERLDAPQMVRLAAGGRFGSQVQRHAMLLLVAALAHGSRSGRYLTIPSEEFTLLAPVRLADQAEALAYLRDQYGVAMAEDGTDQVWSLPARVRGVARFLPHGWLEAIRDEQLESVRTALCLLDGLAALGLDERGTVTTTYEELTTALGLNLDDVLEWQAYLLDAQVLARVATVGSINEGFTRWHLSTEALA